MKSVLYKAAVFGVCAFAFTGATPADAKCRGVPQINLSDGSKACVVRKGTTEFTATQSVQGGGPATKRQSKSEGGFVSLHFLNEASAKATTRGAIRKRALEVCASYKDEFLSRIAKPGNPFIVVVMGWGDAPGPSLFEGRLSPSYREIYLTKNCRVKHSK